MNDKYITNNPIVRMNTLRVVSKKYEGYIAGLGGNNKLSLFTPDEELKKILSSGEQALQDSITENDKTDYDVRDVLNVFLDTSSGCYLVKDYLTEKKLYSHVKNMNRFKETGGHSKKLGSSLTILSQDRFFNDISNEALMLVSPDNNVGKTIAATSILPFSEFSQLNESEFVVSNVKDKIQTEGNEDINKILAIRSKYSLLTFNELKEEVKKQIADDAKTTIERIKKILTDKDNEEKQQKDQLSQVLNKRLEESKKGSLREDINTIRANIEDFIVESDIVEKFDDATGSVTYERSASGLPIENSKSASNNNFSMHALVFCNQNIQRSSKNKDYLNVFLNAIPHLEMSRCTPFLDVTVYHKNTSKNKKKFLNHEYHMRFLKKNNGSFELDEKSLSNAKRLNIDEREKSLETAFMSIFTSPQTMANGNINNKNQNMSNDENFLEPIVPLLTLANFQVTIDGMGFGMVSSRKGSMSLVLHDRSRLKDIAPFVSLNQLVDTSMRIEFGWSHPDGDPISSDNDIGKFLNALRDVQYYNLTGTNLQFNNNSVNIELQLASSGHSLMNGVSAAAGIYSPLNFVSKRINKIIDDIIQSELSKSGNSNKEKQEGILKKINIVRSTFSSQTAVIKTEHYKKILNDFDNPNISNHRKLFNIAVLLGLIDEAVSIQDAYDNYDISMETLFNMLGSEENLVKKSNTLSKLTARLIRDKLIVARHTPDFDYSETTNSIFQDLMSSNTNINDETHALSDLNLINQETISFGKLVLMYCGLPMMSTGEFAEVQVCFYPINNNAGGARRFTTASLPIEYSIVRDTIEEKFLETGNISVKGMFQLLANLFEDTTRTVYGVGSFDFDYEKTLSTLTDDEKKSLKEIAIEKFKADVANEQSIDAAQAEAENQTESVQNKPLTAEQEDTIFKLYLKDKQYEDFKKSSSENLKKIYDSDGMTAVSIDSFSTPNLQMHMEVLPLIDPNVSTKGSNVLDEFFFGAIKTQKDDSYKDDKKILRIHVYDTRSNGSEVGELLNKILNDEVSDILIGKKPVNSQIDVLKAESIDSSETKGSRLISKIPTSELKNYVKRNYPNVTWGTSSSVVKNLSVSSNTNDTTSKLIMIRRKADEKAAGGTKNRISAEEEISINPSSISLDLFGCPFIDRGTQIFVDTGTGTDLDNVYTVNNITHTVKSGEFQTSLSLTLTAQGAISSTRRKLSNKLKVAVKEIQNNSGNPIDASK